MKGGGAYFILLQNLLLVQKLLVGNTQTDGQLGDLISLTFLF
jgi:hypothetical protein